jgi:hypothetical protein
VPGVAQTNVVCRLRTVLELGKATKNDGLPQSESAVQLFLGHCTS